VFITTAIAYNYYINTNDATIVFLNCLFLGLAFIGWESRYNIDYYKLKHNIQIVHKESDSKYAKWCKNKGVIKAPISLPEIFLFYLIIAPSLKLEFYSLMVIILFLFLRIVLQQKFWFNVIKSK
jgi:hypothetical protein